MIILIFFYEKIPFENININIIFSFSFLTFYFFAEFNRVLI